MSKPKGGAGGRDAVSRREFLRLSAAVVAGLSARGLGPLAAQAEEGASRPVELRGYKTRVVLSRQNSGIQKLALDDGTEIPFLFPPLTMEHFFTGAWPPPKEEVPFEPLYAPSTVTRESATRGVWHQPTTGYSRVETRIEYELVARGTVEARIEMRSHARSYPHGYVGVFWAMMAPPGGQRGVHLLMPAERGVQWRYFAGGGDSWAARANGVLGPEMRVPARDAGYPARYYFAESGHRFALPVQVGRWRDLYYSVELDSADIAFADVLLGTAVGGSSWDVYWCLKPGESRTVRARVTVDKWPGWRAVEARYRAWDGCTNRTFSLTSPGPEGQQPFAKPEAAPSDDAAMRGQERFAKDVRPVLERLQLLDRVTVGQFDTRGEGLTFLLQEKDRAEQAPRLKEAFGADAEVQEIGAWLRARTGMPARPETAAEWLPHIQSERAWQEQLWEAGQGAVLHDPGMQVTDVWRHATGYVPPDIHRALLARALVRMEQAGQGDFAEALVALAFCWNEQFLPPVAARTARFHQLPICPEVVPQGVEWWSREGAKACAFEVRPTMERSVKWLMQDLYHVQVGVGEPLTRFAEAIRGQIEEEAVRRAP